MKALHFLLVGLFLLGCTPIGHAEMTRSLTLGARHTCALTSAGGVMCWGGNAFGQLGNGTIVDSQVPVEVNGLGSGVTQIATGAYHTCALLASGAVKCWGRNADGQLGTATVNDSRSPVPVAGLSSVGQIAAGSSHSCAALVNGSAKCWGDNRVGQLGDGTLTRRLTAVDVVGLVGVSAMALGGSHSCAIVGKGQVKCWGENSYGQLGNRSNVSRKTAVDVEGLDDAGAIVAGQNHTCIKTTSGTAKCWGYNGFGQLGNGTTSNANTPGMVPNLSGIVQISAGRGDATCVGVFGGIAKCWGLVNAGQLGGDETGMKYVPTHVIGLAGPVSVVEVGSLHACAKVGAGVQCWGDNSNGQHGAGNSSVTPFPQYTVGMSGGAPFGSQIIAPVLSRNPVYIWHPAPGAAGYRLRINGITYEYTAAQVNCPDGVGLCTVASPYWESDPYSWQVQPFNADGDGPWSNLSQ